MDSNPVQCKHVYLRLDITDWPDERIHASRGIVKIVSVGTQVKVVKVEVMPLFYSIESRSSDF